MKTYSILNQDYSTLFSTTSFEKDILTNELEKAIRVAKEGEEVMYGYSDEKYCFAPSLVVEIRKGKAMLQVTKGSKTFYKEYIFKTAA